LALREIKIALLHLASIFQNHTKKSLKKLHVQQFEKGIIAICEYHKQSSLAKASESSWTR